MSVPDTVFDTSQGDTSIGQSPDTKPTQEKQSALHSSPAADAIRQPVATLELQSDPALWNLCERTTWRSNLWLQCHSGCGPDRDAFCGGLNNARNRFQSCVRLAIDAGANLIVSKFVKRNPEDIGRLDTQEDVCEDEYFNAAAFQSYLATECPQMQVELCGNRRGIDNIVSMPARFYKETAHSVGTFRAVFDEALATANQTDSKKSAVVLFSDSILSWNYALSGELETVRPHLYRSIEFDASLLQLGEKVYQTIKNTPLIAIHFRGESDWPDSLGSADQMLSVFIPDLDRLRNTTNAPKDLYISCGEAQGVDRLTQLVEPLGYRVHTKSSLLDGNPELQHQIESLDFDHRTIVEYHTLISAEYFYGVGTSSFTSLVAYTRTVATEPAFFQKTILKDTKQLPGGVDFVFPESPAIRGDKYNRLFVVNAENTMNFSP